MVKVLAFARAFGIDIKHLGVCGLGGSVGPFEGGGHAVHIEDVSKDDDAPSLIRPSQGPHGRVLPAGYGSGDLCVSWVLG